MTFVELTVTLLVLVVAVGGTLGSVSSFVALGDSSREGSDASVGAQRVLEEMSTETFSELFARYNADASDDPAGGGPGSGFAIDGLQLQRNDPDGLVGTIVLPADAAAPTVLREDLDMPELGLPRDLNGDNVIDSADHSGDYLVLPVLVRVEWRSQTGNRLVEVMTLLRRPTE